MIKMFCRNICCTTKLIRKCSTYSKSLFNLYGKKSNAEIVESFKDTELTVKGWVKNVRKMKENVFCDVSDGSCDKILQVVINQAQQPKRLSSGSSIVANGYLNITPKGQLELRAKSVSMCGPCVATEGYPFVARQCYSPESIREHLHLRTRTNFFASVLRVRHAATFAIHDCFIKEGFINIATPVLTSNDCEGAGEVFKVMPDNGSTLKAMTKRDTPPDEAYFNGKTFLTVSGQLQLESAAHGLSKVYTFGPVFRAENSKSRLHLSEFYMVEAEIAFVNEIDCLTTFIEKLIKYATATVLEKCENDLMHLRGDDNRRMSWLDKSFAVLTYTEAINILRSNSKGATDKDGLTKEQELFLVDHNGGVPLFVIDWPMSNKPFYVRECSNDSSKVAAFDLLVPNVGELVGGGLRENDYKKLKEKLPTTSNDLDWYLDIRKFGGAPTGGFGLGFERYLQFITDIVNIKDTIPFPRWPHNCSL